MLDSTFIPQFLNHLQCCPFQSRSLTGPQVLYHCSHHNHFPYSNSLLATNPYVIVIALDFTKAFDTVRHHTLLNKIAKLDIPDHIYNWLTYFFTGHSHQTHYGGSVSQIQCISASIIQGSAVGPASYVANASDLHTIYHANELCKYADDTYLGLIVPTSNVDTRTAELKNITEWATLNNLSLNLSTRRPASADRTARAANFRRDLEAT